MTLYAVFAAEVFVLAAVVHGQTPLPEPMKIRVDASYAEPLPFERGAARSGESEIRTGLVARLQAPKSGVLRSTY